MTITDYQIFQIANISGNDYYKPGRSGGHPITDLLKKGWQPHGSPFLGYGQSFYQAFVKYEKTKK